VIRLDGNAIGGVLEEIFGRDLTIALGICANCRAQHQVGGLHVYRAAGVVVRCPDCDAVLMRIVEAPQRIWVDLQGISTLQVVH
jgi:Family of unknown function (DUF6510)